MTDHVLIRRRDAAQATLDRFGDKPLDWLRFDCGRMTAFHLRLLGLTPPLAKAGGYRSALGAKRALARLGCASLADVLDRMALPRIAPAAAIVGDIVAMPSEGPLDALGIALGNGRALAYHESATGAVVLQPLELLAAWRAL